MRFARIHCDNDAAPAGLEELLGRAELDFLQLDYARPRQTAVTGNDAAELPGFAPAFAETLGTLAKTLYLQPEFRVIGSAGWESAYECIERGAQILVEAGCGD